MEKRVGKMGKSFSEMKECMGSEEYVEEYDIQVNITPIFSLFAAHNYFQFGI